MDGFTSTVRIRTERRGIIAALLFVLAGTLVLTGISARPARASGFGGIGAGSGHSCAINAAGGVDCWGNNQYGQLGNGVIGGQSLTPVAVSGLSSGVVAITLGENFTCALTAGGDAECWGWNIVGQLGNGTNTDSATPVTTLTGVSSLSAGLRHACAIVSGTVWCWGQNTYGQLGDASTTTRFSPVSVIAGASAIAAGGDFTCAGIGGGVVCWGNNTGGELGDDLGGQHGLRNRTSPYQFDGSLAYVYGLTGVAALSAGYNYACALVSSGAVTCWGYGGQGTMGNGTTTPDNVRPVSGPAGPFTSIAAGYGSACAVTTARTVKCWGSGYLGNGTGLASSVPVDVIGLANVAEVAYGDSHGCARLDNGTLWCWGYNLSGGLGDGTTNQAWVPVQVVFRGAAATPVATTTLSSSAIALGASVTDGVTVTGAAAGGAPTGSITVTMYSDAKCTQAVGSGVTAALIPGAGNASTASGVGPFTPATAGTFYLQAHYNSGTADPDYTDADSVCGDGALTVGAGTSSVVTTVRDASLNVIANGASVPLGTQLHALATVTPSGATAPSGSVDFRSYDSLAACTADSALTSGIGRGNTALDGANPGVADPSDAVADFAAGTHAFRSRWAGDGNYAGAVSGCVSFTVSTAAPTLALQIRNSLGGTVTSVVLGTPVHPRIALSGPAGAPIPSGTVTVRWFTNGTCKGNGATTSAQLGVDGTVDLTAFTQVPAKAGSFAFQASYAGDASYLASSGPCSAIVATAKLAPGLLTVIRDALGTAVTSVPSGSTVHDSISVTGGGPTPTGTVTIKWFTNGTCKGRAAGTSSALALSGGGIDATAFAQTPTAAAKYAFQVTYSGDATYTSVVGSCEVLTVT